jgi:uncharacterized protein (TIGR03085 family)
VHDLARELLTAERHALCDTLVAVGPDAPTLCEGWRTLDLAAHLLVRETRPDSGPGLVVPGPLARWTERVRVRAKRRGYDDIVAALRGGPPGWFTIGPMAALNVTENWIHHEDVRRANGHGPRPADDRLEEVLWDGTRLSARMVGRRLHGAGLVLRTSDGRERVARDRGGEPVVTASGAPGELVLFLAGRKEAAEVMLDGEPEAVALVLAARFGV